MNINFTVIDNRPGHIRTRGYQLKKDADLHFDQNWFDRLDLYDPNTSDNLVDDFFDGWNAICLGDDGKIYAVHFHGPNFDEPGIWHEAEPLPVFPAFTWDQINQLTDLNGFVLDMENKILRWVRPVPVLPLGVPRRAYIDLMTGNYVCDTPELETYLRARVDEILSK